MQNRPSLSTIALDDLQEASAKAAQSKYYAEGESSPADVRARVAKTLAAVEREPEKHIEEFREVLKYAYPGGRTLANAGVEHLRPGASTINCTVSGTIHDSMAGIMERASEAALTLKAGAGIGYDFTPIRPRGATVRGAGASTSGVLPFMDIFDAVCKTVSSAGGRRGAQMGVLEINHPDVEDFVVAKRTNGRLRAFNLSVNVTHAFIEAVRQDADWDLIFPLQPMETAERTVWHPWPAINEGYQVNEFGDVLCRVYKTVKARDLWELILSSTYNYSDPGFLVMDTANEMNPLWFAETMRASNPCGEQKLPPYGACLLGSINLARLVIHPFSSEARFDFEKFEWVAEKFARLLDNVVEINNLPLEQQRAEIQRKRRHGMGYFGLGSVCTMLGIRYGSAESVELTEQITRTMAVANWRAGLDLALEKGPAPIMDELFEITPRLMRLRPEMANDGIGIGDMVPGRILHARYSRYMQRIATVAPQLVEDIAKHGARFTHATCIAPTGTMAFSLGNNASNGIEPTFAHSYTRNMIEAGRKTKSANALESLELRLYRQLINPDVEVEDLPEAFRCTANELPPAQHIAVMAAAQRWVDAAVSKTVNVPSDISYEDFKSVYDLALASGLKGCTTFRPDPEVHQGVLVTAETSKSSLYRFTLDDGTVVEGDGATQVEYDGHITTMGNLHEALKEGTYGSH